MRVSSGVAEGMLVHQVKPQYPALAVQARIQGTVVLQAVIGKDGTIRELRLISGHPMLAPAAIEAVKQWQISSLPVEWRAGGSGHAGECELHAGWRMMREQWAGRQPIKMPGTVVPGMDQLKLASD